MRIKIGSDMKESGKIKALCQTEKTGAENGLVCGKAQNSSWDMTWIGCYLSSKEFCDCPGCMRGFSWEN